jgi:SAM-dependent methyltransferase
MHAPNFKGDVADRELVEVYAGIQSYYTAKITAFGPTPHGADWNSTITQEVRFVQLLKLCDFSGPFALNDVGCGYGALWSYLTKYHSETDIDYVGFDVSPAMIEHAGRLRRDLSRASFIVANTSPRVADYSVASGVFNVKLDQPFDRWERFIAKTLVEMHTSSRRGFAVNFMTPQASDRVPQELYRTVPEPWVRFCETELESSAEVLADYGLREFTLLIRPKGSAGQSR